MKSAFKNISDMNIAYGNPYALAVEDKDGVKIIKPNKVVTLVNQAKNVKDEAIELKEDGFSVLLKDPASITGRKEMFDAIGDILVFAHGVGHMLGEDITDENRSDGLGEPLLGFEMDELLSEENQTILNKIINQAKIENRQDVITICELMTDKTKDSEKFYNNFYEILISETEQLVEKIRQEDLVGALDCYDTINDLCEFLFKNKAKPGYTIDLLIDRIVSSNLSKICRNEKEVEETIAYYEKLGVEVYSKESPLIQDNGSPFLLVCSSKEQTVKVLNESKGEMEDKIYRANKILKNVHWFEPNLFDF